VKAILFVFDLVVLLIIKKGKFDERYFLAAWLPSVWSNNLILGIPMLSAFYDPTTVQSVCLLSAIPDFFPQSVSLFRMASLPVVRPAQVRGRSNHLQCRYVPSGRQRLFKAVYLSFTRITLNLIYCE